MIWTALIGAYRQPALMAGASGRGERMQLRVLTGYCANVTSDLDTLPKIGAPATRALAGVGYTSLRQLAGVSRSELGKLHGMGPKALGILEAALAEHGLALD